MAYTLKIKNGIEWKTVKQVNYITYNWTITNI